MLILLGVMGIDNESAQEKDEGKRAWFQVWTEHIRKELKSQKLNTEFSANPSTRKGKITIPNLHSDR